MEHSVVIPVFNERESLDQLFSEIVQSLDPLTGQYEIIFVDDGSDDGTSEWLKKTEEEKNAIVRVIRLDQRSGQTVALRTGLNAARGRIAITLDADLQNDPADIPRLLEKMNEGYDMVCGWRRDREDTAFKARMSKLGNFLQRRLTDLRIHDGACTLRAFKATCIKDIPLDREGQHRFIPLMLAKKGYKIGEIISNHRKRLHGESKYTHKRLPQVVIDFFKISTSK